MVIFGVEEAWLQLICNVCVTAGSLHYPRENYLELTGERPGTLDPAFRGLSVDLMISFTG
jgi:hypothetical protein